MGTRFLWDPVEDNIVKELDDSNTTAVDYTTEPFQYGQLIAQHRDDEPRFYHFDGQGSTTELTNHVGDVTDTRRYSAFGEIINNTGSTKLAFQYIGQFGYYHGNTQVNVRSRQYHPASARWNSLDRARVARSDCNRYVYVNNRPLSAFDPSGLTVVAFRPRTPVGIDWYDWLDVPQSVLGVVLGLTLANISVTCYCTIHRRRRCSLSCHIGAAFKILINRTLIDCLNGRNLGVLTGEQLENCLEVRRQAYQEDLPLPSIEGTYGHEQRHVASLMARLEELKRRLNAEEDKVNRKWTCCTDCVSFAADVSAFAAAAICNISRGEAHPDERSQANPPPYPEGSHEYPPLDDSFPDRPAGTHRWVFGEESLSLSVNGREHLCYSPPPAVPDPPKPPTRPPL